MSSSVTHEDGTFVVTSVHEKAVPVMPTSTSVCGRALLEDLIKPQPEEV